VPALVDLMSGGRLLQGHRRVRNKTNGGTRTTGPGPRSRACLQAAGLGSVIAVSPRPWLRLGGTQSSQVRIRLSRHEDGPSGAPIASADG
jgi:hypothetical protein